MAARTPRRNFARPFVVTLAAAPACYTAPAPPPPQPPPAAPAAEAQPAPPPTIVANPPPPESRTPPPEPTPPIPRRPPNVNPPPPHDVGPADGTKWTVFKTKDGCEATFHVECPHGEPGKPMPTCNPPPPRPYTCPPNVTLDHPITIVASGGTCMVEAPPMHCPAGAMCNPPPPRRVECPK
jgi:hypothetical protein